VSAGATSPAAANRFARAVWTALGDALAIRGPTTRFLAAGLAPRGLIVPEND
jgi:hypothetical protein